MQEKKADEKAKPRAQRDPLVLIHNSPHLKSLRQKLNTRLRRDAEEWEQRSAETSSAVEAALRFVVR